MTKALTYALSAYLVLSDLQALELRGFEGSTPIAIHFPQMLILKYSEDIQINDPYTSFKTTVDRALRFQASVVSKMHHNKSPEQPN
jgi:hypothetical protein